jgi:hypothetical protein
MNPAPGSVFCEPQLAAKPQLKEKPCQGFATWKTAWNPGPNVANSTTAIGLRAGLVLEGVRKTYRARYYNPTTGRFLSEDPIGFAGGINLYAYANYNPLSMKDPFGTCAAHLATLNTCDLLQLIGVLAGIAIAVLTLFAMAGFAGLIVGIMEMMLIFDLTALQFLAEGALVASIAAGAGKAGSLLGLCH